VNSLILISVHLGRPVRCAVLRAELPARGSAHDPFNTGLVLFPQAMVMMVMMPMAGRIYDRIGARWPAIIGLALAGGGTLLLTKINIDLTRQS